MGHERSNAELSRFKHIKIALRLAIGAALLLFLLMSVNISEMVKILSVANLWLLVAASLIGIVGIVLSAYKWQVLLSQASKTHVSLTRLVSLYFIGSFFNNCLPTTVGGDVIRVTKLSRITGGFTNSMMSVLIERVTGFLALTVIASLAMALTLDHFPGMTAYAAPSALALSTGAVAVFLVIPGLGFLETAISKVRHDALSQKLTILHQSLICYASARRVLAYVLVISFIFQSLGVYSNYLVAVSMDLNVSLIDIAMVIQIVTIASLVPVSISGLGVKEGAFVLLFAYLGVGTGQAMAFAIINRLITLLISLPGGILFMVDRNNRNRENNDLAN